MTNNNPEQISQSVGLTQGMGFLYTFFDANIREYSAPAAFETEMALDQFVKILVRTHSHSRQHTHPEDFAIFRIATYDPETGNIDVFPEKQFVNSFSAYALQCKYCKADEEMAELARNLVHDSEINGDENVC